MAIDDEDKKIKYNKMVSVLIGFAAVCFITSLIMNRDIGTSYKASFSSFGGELGPINVKKNYSVYEISIKQSLHYNGAWSFVGGDVLDENKNYLFGFGKELWKASGYDSDGPWSEEETKYDIKTTFPKKGIYYLRFKAESNQESTSDIHVKVSPKQGSSLAHFVLAILCLIMGVGLWVYTNLSWGDVYDNEEDY